MELSSLANALLLRHRTDNSDTAVSAAAFHQVPEYTDDEVSAAYAELAASGLMKHGPRVSVGSVYRRQYRLTGTSPDAVTAPGDTPAVG